MKCENEDLSQVFKFDKMGIPIPALNFFFFKPDIFLHRWSVGHYLLRHIYLQPSQTDLIFRFQRSLRGILKKIIKIENNKKMYVRKSPLGHLGGLNLDFIIFPF